jgi:hypothetical protein
MTSPIKSPDLIEQIFGNNAVKAGLAAITVFATLAKYIREAVQRRRKAAEVASRFRLSDSLPFSFIVRAPAIIHQFVAIVALLLSVLEIALLADQYANAGRILASLPAPIGVTAGYVTSWFVGLIVLAGIFYFLFELRIIEGFLAWLVGLIPSARHTIGWANAKWHTAMETDDRRVLAPSADKVDATASRLIDEIVASQANTSLALRPAGLDNEAAANILYFGHVFEAYRAAQGDRYSAWTALYAALGQVALAPEKPFAAASLRAWPGTTSFLSVMRKANGALARETQIPNSAGLEEAIERALSTLRRRWKGNARNVACDAFGRSSYEAALRNAQDFLRSTGMRRQFAKLFILWGLEPGAKRPSVFRIPFNARMFIRYLDEEVLEANGDKFNFDSEPVQICFEVAERMVVERAFNLLTQSRDLSRVSWRTDEKQRIDKHNIDWRWWVYYRIDTQAYYAAQAHASTNWEIQGNQEAVRV